MKIILLVLCSLSFSVMANTTTHDGCTVIKIERVGAQYKFEPVGTGSVVDFGNRFTGEVNGFMESFSSSVMTFGSNRGDLIGANDGKFEFRKNVNQNVYAMEETANGRGVIWDCGN